MSTKLVRRRKNKDFSNYAEAQEDNLLGVEALIEEQRPTFKRMVIVDVITDPQSVDTTKQDYWKKILGVTNSKYINQLPRNTAIVQPVLDGVTRVSKLMFAFPFFPSHLALPCKPGEIVWCMVENPAAGIKDTVWWICKIQGLSVADDVNHSHFGYNFNPTFTPDTARIFENKDKPLYSMYNGRFILDKNDNPIVIDRSQTIPSDKENVFEQLIKQTDAGRLMQHEAVPRFRKRPGDIALEGSNNTLIVLGTDRVGPAGNYNGIGYPYAYPTATVDPTTEKNPQPTPLNNLAKLPDGDYFGKAGSIDLVAGRGTLIETGGTVVPTLGILSGKDAKRDPEGIKKEIGKSAKELKPREGDPDFKHDRSRVLIAQRTAVDKNFGLAEYQEQFNIQDTSANAAVVIKSDKVRIIARSDISLIVTNYEENLRYNPESSAQTESFYQDNDDQKKWASITIKRNGDIIFTPSEKGYIKLGGDDADKPILCSDIPVDTVKQAGDVTRGGVSYAKKPNPGAATAIFTTGNKQVGTGEGGQGTFAKKVLVT